MFSKRFFHGILLSSLSLILVLVAEGRDAWAVYYNSSTGSYQWTDDLTPSESAQQSPSYVPSPVKEMHMRELREAVNNVRSICGLAPLNWNASQYAAALSAAPEQRVASVQIYALRAAIAQTYADKGLNSAGVPSSTGSVNSVWVNSDADPGARIRKSHIQDMRLALNHLASTCGSPCGATTWQPGGVVELYATDSTCGIYGTQGPAPYTICSGAQTAGAACDGSLPSCVIGSSGSWNGATSPMPWGPGYFFMNCDGQPGPAPCDCGFQTLVCGCPAAATCADGIQNQGETGVDCGGPCAACATCADGIQNQGEAGIDCGGPCPACVIDECANPTSCDSSQLGYTYGGTCGCGNPNGSFVETIGAGCRRYQCQNGVWIDKGAVALCHEAASCA